MKTIKDIEVQFGKRISEVAKELGLMPEGYRASARLRGDSRNKRQNASFETNWSPDTDTINIAFEPAPEQSPSGATGNQPTGVATSLVATNAVSVETDPLSDLVRALARAESRPGYRFVALRWFRDTALPSEGFAWAAIDSERKNVLHEAIDKRLILTSKEPNPKDPRFPVTAIRLNRFMPEVFAILGIPDKGTLDFQPVRIQGEDLSATILRDRR